MRKIAILMVCASLCATLSSCFKDEPPGAECDIEQAYVHQDEPLNLFYALTDTMVSVPSDMTAITFRIKAGADLTQLSPMFRLTEGATVQPESGSTHDFSDGKTVDYTVTSEDGQYSRHYSIGFKTYNPISEFSFENYKLTDGPNQGQIYVWSDLNPDGSEAGNWATGNGGFNLSMGTAKPDEYPTVPTDDAVSGKGVKLETKSTGALGALVNKRLAAGNLFTGAFDVRNALQDAMQATQFGLPFDRKPLRLTGWYKYKAGTTYQDKDGKEVSGKADHGDIYAVFYRNHDTQGNALVLHGDDVRTNSCIVAVADVGLISDTPEWTEFTVDFAYNAEIDPQLLLNQGYNLAVVCTSSKEGASFCGAIGSTLYVDEIKVIWEE